MSKYRRDRGDVRQLSPGERLRIALGNLRLSQAEVAEKCGLSAQYINNILNRNQRLTQPLSIALVKEIGINLNWIYMGEGPIFLEDYYKENDDSSCKNLSSSLQKSMKEVAEKLNNLADAMKELEEPQE